MNWNLARLLSACGGGEVPQGADISYSGKLMSLCTAIA